MRLPSLVPVCTVVRSSPPPLFESAGKGLKARNTKLEEDSFGFITGYDTIMHMGQAMKHPITPELTAQLQQLADAHGAAPAPMFAAATPVQSAADKVLESLNRTVLKTVNVSVDSSFWDWGGQPPPQPRFTGKPTSWVSKEKTAIHISWEVGRDENGDQIVDSNNKPKYAATDKAEVKKLMQHGLRLEPFDDGAPAPTTTDVPEGTHTAAPLAQQPAQGVPAVEGVAVSSVSDAHLLSAPDFTDIKYLLALARAIVGPAAKYFVDSMEGKRGAQLARMKAVRFFNPMHVLASGEVTVADIDGMSLLRLSTHPKVQPAIEVRPALPRSRHSMHACTRLTHPHGVLAPENEGRGQQVQHAREGHQACCGAHGCRGQGLVLPPRLLARARARAVCIFSRAASSAGARTQLHPPRARVLHPQQHFR